MIHLDTSFLIRAIEPGTLADRQLRRWLAEGAELGISAVAWAEFLCGPLETSVTETVLPFVREPVAFQRHDAELAARLFHLAGRRRGSIADCMIAAVALHSRAELATSNARDFQRFAGAGLKVIAV